MRDKVRTSGGTENRARPSLWAEAEPWQRRTMGGHKIKLTSDWASGQSVNAEHFLLWLCKISSTDPFKTLMSKWLSNAKCQLANFSSARHLVSEIQWWWCVLDCNKWWSSPSQCYICKHNLSLKPVTSGMAVWHGVMLLYWCLTRVMTSHTLGTVKQIVWDLRAAHRWDWVTMHDLLMKRNNICIVDSNAMNLWIEQPANSFGWCRRNKHWQRKIIPTVWV